jgi:hypothetical protein
MYSFYLQYQPWMSKDNVDGNKLCAAFVMTAIITRDALNIKYLINNLSNFK